MRIPTVLLFTALLAAGAALIGWPYFKSPPGVASAPPHAAPASVVVGSVPSTQATQPTPSRSGMQEAVSRFELGYAGGLQVNEDTRRTLEMATSAMADTPADEDLGRLQAALLKSLPHEDVTRIMSLTRGYIAYTKDMTREVPTGPMPGTLAEFDAMHARIADIRRRHFGTEASAALFGPHDAYARLVLEASLVEIDPSLNGDQKIAKLTELRALLPLDQQPLVSAPVQRSPTVGQSPGRS